MVSNCYYCRSTERSHVDDENGFELVRCDSCGLLYVSNPPDLESIAQAATQGLHPGDRELDVTGVFKAGKVREYRRILDEIYDRQPPDEVRWLDIGCGHGEFLTALRVWGIPLSLLVGSEPNVKKQAEAVTRGFAVDFIDLDTHTDSYARISLLNVYSHLPDPENFLTRVRSLLDADGELLLQTGDAAVFSDRDLPRPLLLPDHLSFVTEEIMRGLLDRCGFEVVSIHKFPWIRFTPSTIMKEAAKLMIPGRVSKLREMGRVVRSDMWLRCRRRD
jgi:SAM-dependent methyltransferase